jgi:hypothetical protein
VLTPVIGPVTGVSSTGGREHMSCPICAASSKASINFRWKAQNGKSLIICFYRTIVPIYKSEITAGGIRHADHVARLYPQKLAPTSLTSGGRLVGIVHSRTQATEFSFF